MEKIVGRKFENTRLGMEIYVYDIDGKEWFIGRDVAKLLGYPNPSTAVSENIKPTQKIKIYVKSIENIESSEITNSKIKEINNNISFISEIGLYQLVMKSRKLEAEEFQKWVYEDVLPSLRKNNFYIDENITTEQSGKAMQILQRKLENYEHATINNKRLKRNLKEYLEQMFLGKINNPYEQFISIMKNNGMLNKDGIPTNKFRELNKKNKFFVWKHEVDYEDRESIQLTNLGMVNLANTLSHSNGILTLNK